MAERLYVPPQHDWNLIALDTSASECGRTRHWMDAPTRNAPALVTCYCGSRTYRARPDEYGGWDLELVTGVQDG